MRKLNFSVHFFLYSLLAYIFYIIYFVFIKKADYFFGLYYFTPAYVFVFIKLFSTGIKKLSWVASFVFIPFAISVFLTFADHPFQGWEVSGFIPVAVLASYLFKSSGGSPTPLGIRVLPKIIKWFFAVVLVFGVIHFIKTRSINDALLLVVTLWTPAPIAAVTALFINFIITTTAASVLLNNMKFFNNEAKISRLIFDTDAFLNVPHLSLSGIETVPELKKEDFIRMIDRLNKAAADNPEQSENIKKNKYFSHSFEDGKTLTMAPLHFLVSEKHCSHEGIEIPLKDTDSEYVALAEDGKIIGYYAIDKVKPTENAAFLELFEKKYGIKSVIVNPVKPQLWKSIETKKSFDEIELTERDIVITDNHRENISSSIEARWGGTDIVKGDIYITKPLVKTLFHFIIVSRKIPEKIVKGAAVCSIPFLFQLFAASFDISAPQISSVALLMSFFMIVIYIFFVKPVSKNSLSDK
ncbi:hypothetical protein J6Z19_09570 [bacterium]|nr:hypothetical protein [bacterium]